LNIDLFLFLFLILLEKNGKNWSKVLDILHKCSHHYTDLKDKDQLRDYYKSLLGPRSIVNTPFVASTPPTMKAVMNVGVSG
jgi:hypothetical protein